MNTVDLGQHISQRFDAELDNLRSQVLTMGGLVERQVADALTALLERDSDLAEVVVSTDVQVNAMEVALDEECNRVLACRHPTASDLRLVVAVIKTITDLERIGDEAERIGCTARRWSADMDPNQRYAQIEHLGSRARQMLRGALDAFARLDPQAAVRVWQQDTRVDAEYEAIMRQFVTYMVEDPYAAPRWLDAMWAARALERIGDRSRNICEYVIYLVKGKDVRHTSLERMEQEVRASHRTK